MGLFSKKKPNVVVKKRTPDIIEYKIFNLQSKEQSKAENTSIGSFTSPVYGKDVKDSSDPLRVSNTPTSSYDAFRNTSAEDEAPEDRYREFRMVKNEKKESNTHVVVEEKHEEPREEEDAPEPQKEERVVPQVESQEEDTKEKEEKATLFKYDDTQEINSSFDKTLFSDLFGVEEKKEKPKDEKKESFFEEMEAKEEKPVQHEEKHEEPQKETKKEVSYKNYKLPPLSLLPDPERKADNNEEWNQKNIEIINMTLQNFRIDGQVKEYTVGPTFTRYAIMLGPGVQGSKISNISTDIQRSLAAPSIRIENPIPGKAYVGIEVPNEKRRTVSLKELICTEEFMNSKDPLLIPVGLDVEGKAKYVSITDFPHGLIAGSSGSGKSVFLGCMLVALLYKDTPDDVRFFFIDPKQVDLQQFKDIPHLVSPIVTETKEAISSLKWIVDEMERRYSVFRTIGGITKLKEYNKYCETHPEYKKMPYLVCVIDEAADFLMDGGRDASDLIVKLVQKSRASGIHLILAMQKPVASVLSTTIKSNTSARFAFRVTDRQDSQTILDTGGANDLLGYGDMMFYLSGHIGRYQGAFISGQDINTIRDYVASQGELDYLFTPSDLEKSNAGTGNSSLDPLFPEVARYVVYEGRCSINAITQRFNVGFNKANSIVQSLEYYGIVSQNLGTKAREILVKPEEIDEKLRMMGF